MATSSQCVSPTGSEGSSSSKTKKNAVEISHVWIIDSLSFHTRDRVVASPPFGAGVNDGVRWCLQLYPSGQGNAGDDKNWVSFYLNLHTCDSGVLVKYRISILNADHDPLQKMFITEPVRLVQGSGWGMVKLIRRDLLFSSKRLPGDRLIVFCELTYALDVVIVPSQSSPVRSQVPDGAQSGVFNGEHFGNQMFSDVVLVANGREFHAHKMILASCSPVFKTMFEENIRGEDQTRFEISDMDDETLREILCIVYTGQSRAVRNMSERLRAAVLKYRLKRMTPSAESSREESFERILIDDDTPRATVVQESTSGVASPQSEDLVSPQRGSNTSESSDHSRRRRPPDEPTRSTERPPKHRRGTS